MDILEFLGQGEAEQWEEFSEHCIFLAKYEDIDVTQHLFKLHDFYVELSSDSQMVLSQAMNAFLYGPRLDKYMAGDLDFIYTDLEIDFP